jgi:AcrR family transcriptional regulator
MAQVRPYRGIEAPDRLAARRDQLLQAGLDLLGAAPEPVDVTVRAVCQRAELTPRYFYESFADKDEFIGTVFDTVIAALATTTQAAMAAAPPEDRTHACMADIVHSITGDPRIGRLVFSTQVTNAVLVRKRHESTALFAMLSGQYAGVTLALSANERLTATAYFVVGGVGQAITAWLDGQVTLTPEAMVDQLTAIIEALGKPRLFRD